MFFKLSKIIMIFTFLFNSHISFAFGGESSGGGDLRAIQFKKIGEMLVELIKNSKELPDEIKNIDWKSLKKAVKDTNVESTNEIIKINSKVAPAQVVIKDGFFGFNRTASIIFNRELWDIVPEGSRRAALVLHEYLRAMGNGDKDENYEISKFLYDDPGFKLLLNNISQTQPIVDGIDLDFMIKCNYKLDNYLSLGKKYEYEAHKYNQEFTLGRGKYSYSGYHGRYIDYNDQTDEVLQLIVYDESDSNNTIIGVPTTNSKSIRVVLGWGKAGFFTMPEKLLFKQSVKITPNFNLNIELQNPGLTLSCHRMLSEELEKEGEWIPVLNLGR